MNDIEKAEKEVGLAMIRLGEAKSLLEKAQKPKIQLEHMGVYRLENGEIGFAREKRGGFWITLFSDITGGGGMSYGIEGVSNYYSPVVEHIGKIGILNKDYQWAYSPIEDIGQIGPKIADPLNLNNK